jgi:hypothetical protein
LLWIPIQIRKAEIKGANPPQIAPAAPVWPLAPVVVTSAEPPEKLRLERGKGANDSQFPLESRLFTTNIVNKKIKKLQWQI